MAVRYDRKFMTEINKVISAYNRKITRLSKSDYSYILPQKFDKEAFKSMKATAVSRSDVRRRMKELQTFTAKGGEKIINVNGTHIPKYQYQNIKSYQRLLKVQTSRRLKEYETRKPVLNAEVQPFTFAQYGNQDYLNLKAKRELLLDKDFLSLSFGERQKYIESLRANTKTVDLGIWQKNFLTIFEDTALSYGYDATKTEIIVTVLKKLTPEQIDDLTFINSNMREIIYGYRKLENIKTAESLEAVGQDVRANLDNVLYNLPEVLKDYLSEKDYSELTRILGNLPDMNE